ncbi:MAG: cation:proton antiporter [Halobacteriales archaeon]
MGWFAVGLPIEDPVAIVALSLVVFLVAPLLLRRFDVPGIIGILLVGTAIGPHGLGLLRRDETIVLLGTVGLVFLMFAAGLEVDINDFLDSPDRSLVFGGLSFSLPLVVIAVAAVWLLGFEPTTGVLFAAAFASHTLLAFPVVDRLELGTNPAVATAIAGTIVTDTLALLVLAVVETRVGGGGSWSALLALAVGLGAFFVGTWVVVPRVGRWFFRNVEEESYFEFLFVASVVFVAGFVAEAVGAHAILGAFLAGLVLNRLIPRTSTLMNRIDFVGEALFIPFFLLSVGMLVDPRAFGRPDLWAIAGVVLVALAVTKLAAAWLTGRLYGFGRAARLTMFGLTTGQAAATLAIALIGFELGLFGGVVVNGVVLVIAVVGIASPVLTDRFGRSLVEFAAEPEFEASPQRVLVPVERYDEATERLLDLSLLVGAAGGEPLYLLAVVGRDARGAADQQVAEAEDRLEKAAEYLAGADVPVETLVRSAYSAPTGVVRAVEDNRITAVVAGMDGPSGFGRRLFGTAPDQLVERCDRQVLRAALSRPVNTAGRIVLLVPDRAGAHPGFLQGVNTVKRLVAETGLPLYCLVVGADADRYESLVDHVEPEVPFELGSAASWRGLHGGDDAPLRDDDLAFALVPREGTRGWDPELRRLPSHLPVDGLTGLVMVHLEASHAGSRRMLLHS